MTKHNEVMVGLTISMISQQFEDLKFLNFHGGACSQTPPRNPFVFGTYILSFQHHVFGPVMGAGTPPPPHTHTHTHTHTRARAHTHTHTHGKSWLRAWNTALRIRRINIDNCLYWTIHVFGFCVLWSDLANSPYRSSLAFLPLVTL